MKLPLPVATSLPLLSNISPRAKLTFLVDAVKTALTVMCPEVTDAMN